LLQNQAGKRGASFEWLEEPQPGSWKVKLAVVVTRATGLSWQLDARAISSHINSKVGHSWWHGSDSPEASAFFLFRPHAHPQSLGS
jgi:hypothetical protein